MKGTFVIIFALIFFSCKKENSKQWTEVNFTVYNHITGEPINDVNGRVSEWHEKFWWGSEVEILDKKLVLNGSYSFEFKAKPSVNYYYGFTAEYDYSSKYYYVSGDNTTELEKGEINNLEMAIVPYGYLKLDILNQTCFDSNDIMLFKRENMSVSSDFTNWSSQRLGCYSYTSPEYVKEYSDTIVINEGDYSIFNIHY